MSYENLSIADLLRSHSEILDELRTRLIIRSANNPTGDYAEWLFCRAFGWEQAGNSVKGYDATNTDGVRYQIKGRRMSRQLSAIRDLKGFDVLAGVLLDADFGVARAALIPASVVRDRSKFTEHTNSHRFLLRDDIWDESGVQDVTENLRRVINI